MPIITPDIYWRLNISASTTGIAANSVKIAEIDFRETAGVDQGNTATLAFASSGDMSLAFDDLPATSWDAAGATLPQTIGLTINTPVVEVMIQADAVDASTAPSYFTIERSTDSGATWTIIKTVSGLTAWSAGEVRLFPVSTGAVIPNTAPVITSNGGGSSVAITMPENTTYVTTVTADDAEYNSILFTTIGGADVALFTIGSSSGVLEFITAPDYENPTDYLQDNTYYVTVQADDGNGGLDEQTILVTVTDVQEAKQGLVWTPVVSVGGVDISASVTGSIRVEADESASVIAEFVMRPGAGSISAGDWLGAAVTIDYRAVVGVGAVQSNIFTGTVDQALYDPNARLTTFNCTDDMQGKFEAMTQAEIDALIVNSRWSKAVFGDYKDGWLYLENVLSTYPQSYDYNVDGVTGTLVDWAAKVTPDFSYDDTSIIDKSIKYSIIPKRELFNKYTITYSYRFGRLLHRDHIFSWSRKFCPYLAKSHELPSREMIMTAATSAGWNVTSEIVFDELPPTNSDPCSSGSAWVLTEAAKELLTLGAIWAASKRWSQDATEEYTITVQAPQSIAWLGEIAYTEAASNQTELNADGWADGIKTPIGRRNSQGDTVQDKYDRTVSDNDIETLIARARTEILASHRTNFVTANIELNPLLQRFHTVRLDANGIVGQGKVASYSHVMDIDRGEAISSVKIAVSLNGGSASGGNTFIEPPTAPNTDPVSAGPQSRTYLETRLGGDDSVPVFDDAWNGFTGNYSEIVGTPTDDQFYQRRFKVTTPDINQDAIDAADGVTAATYSYNIPNETLTITVS